jgi:hypothetical protein
MNEVYFAYCDLAREAGRTGTWTVTQLRQATDVAAVIISEYYYVRGHSVASDEEIARCCALFVEGIKHDPRGKQHNAEIAAMANGAHGNSVLLGVGDESEHLQTGDRACTEISEKAEKPQVEGGRAARGRAKPGPKRDFEGASKVAAIVASIATDCNWRSKLDDICGELDEQAIAYPRTWKDRGHRSWYDCLSAERHLVDKAISHHLKVAKLPR